MDAMQCAKTELRQDFSTRVVMSRDESIDDVISDYLQVWILSRIRYCVSTKEQLANVLDTLIHHPEVSCRRVRGVVKVVAPRD